jgi:hypothetical protein
VKQLEGERTVRMSERARQKQMRVCEPDCQTSANTVARDFADPLPLTLTPH